MRAASAGAVALAVASGAAVLVERHRFRSASRAGGPSGHGSESRWYAVTVNRARHEVWPDGEVPAPLRSAGPDVEIELRAAPGDKGTEVRARFRDPRGSDGTTRGRAAATERVRRLRRALREAKQLVEVGEVLRVDPVPHGERKRTPFGAAVEWATDRGPEEGLL
ncbi:MULTISPECIES: hypothetical protein [unclassified Curtobacterium]|uniref:hypothetical protein n=1 Tax=unclassified Curtobacterium TaxID=257496 RepID=UPI0011142AD6|nr:MULTISPECIES: hypothetical protein [unclassified Curtobacterium]